MPVGEQIQRACEVAREICANAPRAVQEIKRGAQVYLDAGEQAAIDEIPTMRQRTANSQDFAEGMASFMEKRPPTFTGE